MYIKTLELTNFRNHASKAINFSPAINIIYGANAVGKTNILESIYFCCLGKGFKSARDRDAIQFGQNQFKIKTEVQKSFGELFIEIIICSGLNQRRGGVGGNAPQKFIKLNATPILRVSELLGNLTCVFFNPDELKLVREAPEDRRRFMDMTISQFDKTYFHALTKYNQILKQRNALLKQFTQTPDEIRSLDIWDAQLATEAEKITQKRIAFISELKSFVAPIHKQFTNDIEDINIDIETMNSKDILSALKSARAKDFKLKTTTIGPHRDDLKITINNLDVRQFASQGQQRTAALSLKLATLKILEAHTNEKPILLLDDVFSELDESRRAKLLALCAGYQTLITTTDKPFGKLLDKATLFGV